MTKNEKEDFWGSFTLSNIININIKSEKKNETLKSEVKKPFVPLVKNGPSSSICIDPSPTNKQKAKAIITKTNESSIVRAKFLSPLKTKHEIIGKNTATK